MTGEDAGETIDGLHVYTLHEIGYGSGEGFKGWNCRHDWHAYYKGISKPNYTPEQIKKLNEKNISYNGKKYTKYEISQMQRQGERNVRALKRRTLAAQTAVENAPDEETKAVLQADYAANAAKLKDAKKQLKTFCSQTGQRRDTFREQVDGFGRSASQKAVHAAKRKKQQAGILPAGHAVEVAPPVPKDNGGTGKTYRAEETGWKSLTSGADSGIIKKKYKSKYSAAEHAERSKKAKTVCDRVLSQLHRDASGTILDKTAKTASGKEVEIVDSTPLYGKPNSITQVVNSRGGVNRNYYDANGNQFLQISNNGHGNPVEEDRGFFGEHAHDYSFGKNGELNRGKARELTKAERAENGDML